ncbi:MAG: Glyoxalase/bleomycin resistance protein/dioxygenase [Caulobacteraceae bacterium]|nr:Glyoxalase/bleomycin resistance protein/dioxygenase [Caulobacteraceae bacterium]
MLSDFPAIATLAVKDLARAKPFYAETLGLALEDENSEVLTFKAGGGQLFVYRSGFAGTNQATGVTWPVTDVEAEVARLKARGVRFEHYEGLEGLELKGDVYTGQGMSVAWFKDPDGNTISLVSGG